MARRKKRGTQSQVPPLTFLNSPNLQPAPVLTPDFAVNNPVTARLVPIGEIQDESWVSPQFLVQSVKNLRSLKGRQRPAIGNQTTLTGLRADETQTRKASKKIKFQPLKFLNETDSAINAQRGVRKMSKVSVTEYSVLDCVCAASALNNQENCACDNRANFEVQTPELRDADENSDRGPDQVKCHDVNSFPQASNEGKTCQSYRGTTGTTPKHVWSVFPSGGALKPRNLLCEMLTEVVDVHEDHPVSVDPNKRSLVTRSSTAGAKCRLADNPSSEPLSTNSFTSRSRNNAQTASFQKPLRYTNLTKILAVDTPKAEYGLTFRQRQLKYKSHR